MRCNSRVFDGCDLWKAANENQRGLEKLRITDVRVRKITKEGRMRAIVSITLDEEFVVHDIKVIEGDKGLFIAMPSRKTGEGEYRDIAHPINSSTRDMLQKTILEHYESAVGEAEQENDGTENDV